MSGNELASIASDGTANDISGYIDTGSYMLNVLLSGDIYGGAAANKITTIAGEQATGKTFFCLGIVREFLKANEEGMVLYFDSESALTGDMLEERDIDSSKVAVLPVATVEDFKTQLMKILAAYMESGKKSPMIVVLDSVGNLSTNKEMEDSGEGKNVRDMTRAQQLKGTFRVLNLKLAQAGVALFATNHTYDVIGSFFPTKEMGGGSGIKYNSNCIIYLTKKKEKDGTEVIGNIIKCKLAKSRITKENSVVELMLNYKTGLSRHYGLLDYAEKYGIFEKVATRYLMPDGTKLFAKAIYKDPEKYFTAEVLNKINTQIKREFCYGTDDAEDVAEPEGLGMETEES